MVPSRIDLLILALLAPRLNQLGQGTFFVVRDFLAPKTHSSNIHSSDLYQWGNLLLLVSSTTIWLLYRWCQFSLKLPLLLAFYSQISKGSIRKSPKKGLKVTYNYKMWQKNTSQNWPGIPLSVSFISVGFRVFKPGSFIWEQVFILSINENHLWKYKRK